ncbi:MAG: GntR family transcriptional regulator [Gammaproteobacteria bacterium]|jgi:DNA-binding GntR family transcriptional regulator|nr:GntR family transcriptional regulator [Gammaproteobacteria bacterium]MBU2178443.1 GntR family transcriptional regulator [Gammaproteobacteria bacterium]MBU2223355.1 GntR family transcriptional regulator [Gammaproteobacteria bacterium]MBU2426709.1 GntR family transcriptional regulator [Gammaproteobacteria bacterium]
MALEFKTRTQVVVEAIRSQILSGQIKAGEPLRQAALAEQLNVSRIPIREALLQLEAEGLVKFEPHKGATATEISPELIDELFELRALMEADLLARSIPLLTEDDFTRAAQTLEQLETALQSPDHADVWSALNTEFHSCLYKANRPQSIEIVGNLNKNADRYIRMHLQFAGGIKKASSEHQRLLDLCRKGDIKGACHELTSHILHAKDEIKQFLMKHASN